ncbi:MAG TPA: hypothetical protein VFO07_09570 [Roseiflexaceae bacterium]|nr:hypothetical protein [Roseiflexaceae bacterium]
MPKLPRYTALIGIGAVVVLIVFVMVALLNPGGLTGVISLGRTISATSMPVSSATPRVPISPLEASATAAAILDVQPFVNPPVVAVTPAPIDTQSAANTQPASAPLATVESIAPGEPSAVSISPQPATLLPDTAEDQREPSAPPESTATSPSVPKATPTKETAPSLPTATKQAQPSATPIAVATQPRPPTATSVPPTRTPQPPTKTSPPPPTDTPRPQPTDTPRPQPTDTPRPQPTDTPQPQPTDTPEPEPTDTPQPEPTRTPVIQVPTVPSLPLPPLPTLPVSLPPVPTVPLGG